MQGTKTDAVPWPRPAKAWYAVFVLVLAFIFSFIDRIIIAMLVGPLKADLGLTETQFGLLSGLAFAVFYALMGIPIGRWADRYSRRTIIGVGIFLWSIMTAVCGLAKNFWQLFAARVGVGVGEATLSPAAYSMIADYFPREQLGRALGVYQSGAFLGAGISFLVGGLVIQMVSGADALILPVIGEIRPWQMVFFAVGLPGVLVALLMATVSEPLRRGTVVAGGIPMAEVMRFAGDNWKVFVTHFFGFALLAVPITTILTWSPAYLTRLHGFTMPQVGAQLGLILVVLSPAGVFAGGYLNDKLLRRGHLDAPLKVAMGAALLLLPISYLATTAATPQLAITLFAPFVFCASLSMAVAPAALQLVVPNQLRAQVSAVWMLFLNLITAGLGPTAVGFVSDRVFDGASDVGLSMALVNCASVPLAALALWLGRGAFKNAAAAQASAS